MILLRLVGALLQIGTLIKRLGKTLSLKQLVFEDVIDNTICVN